MDARRAKGPQLAKWIDAGPAAGAAYRVQRSIRQQIGEDWRVCGHDVLGLSEALPRLEQFCYQPDPAGMNTVLRLLEADQRRRLPHPGEGQQPEHSQRPLGQHARGNRDAALTEAELDLANFVHFDLDAVDARHQHTQCLLDTFEAERLARSQGVEKGSELLAHQTDMAAPP